MALSEHEQRMFEEIEQSLAAGDPKFRATVKSTNMRALTARKIRLSIALVVLGLVVLVGGVWLRNVPVGVIGFLVMLGGGVVGVLAAQRPVTAGKDGKDDKKPANPNVKSKFEDRLRRRFEQ